jgi:hypothetical protein
VRNPRILKRHVQSFFELHKMSQTETIEFSEEKGVQSEESPIQVTGNDSLPLAPERSVRKSVIDLTLGLEEVSPVKVKKGAIDLSLGLSYEESDQKVKSSVPSSLLKYGLERQGSLENGYATGEADELSPELLSLLQSSAGESTEAWEDKVDERRRSLPSSPFSCSPSPQRTRRSC